MQNEANHHKHTTDITVDRGVCRIADIMQFCENERDNMTFKEAIKISEDFYDTIDFTKFMHVDSSKIDVKDLMNCLEDYYNISHPELLPLVFHECFFNFINEDEFAEYLSKRYGYKIITEVIEKHFLQIKN